MEKEHQGADLPRQQRSRNLYRVTFHFITAAQIRANQTCCLDCTSHTVKPASVVCWREFSLSMRVDQALWYHCASPHAMPDDVLLTFS